MQTHECNDKTQICPKEGEDAVDEGTGRAVVDIEDDFHDHVPRDYVESSTTAKEEQAYEMAKSFLLNCATPDSVLRLKYSEIGTSEKEELQRSYFLHQSHQSLRDLLESHLNSTDKYKSRFLEVTTFSSLLTRADIRSLGRALGLSLDRILLVSLHQFDTEASFCSKIRSFLRESSSSLHILLVQIDMEESLCRNELIASGKYCTMNEIMSSNSDVCNCSCVFLTKLSRIGEQCIANGNKYVGFQGGMWLSTHIDDLRDSDDMSFDARQFCGKPISSLISQAIQSDASDSEKLSSEELESKMGSSLSLNSLSLIRSCTQKAVSLLRDSSVKNSRSLERMNILFGLFGDEPGPIAARFQDILLRRLVPALVQWEDLVLNAKDWAYKEASNREALQEGGTLRHTLWRKLQAVCTPSLAQMLEVLDRDCNLHLLYGEGLSQGLSHFWLDVFQDRLLDLSLTLNASPSEQELDVKYHLFVGEEERPCSAPFSWRIRTCCQSLWEESEFLQGCERGNKARIQQFVSAVSGCGLGNYVEKLSESEKNELGQRYLTDYVLLSFKIHSDEMLEVFRSAVLGCVFALQKELSVNPHLSFPWIQAAAQVYSPRLETLSHALQLNPLLVRMVHHQRSGMEDVDMCEDILAVGISVEETKCLPLTSISQCRDFLHKVEQLQPCVERVFNSKYCSLCSPRHLKHLDAIKSVWQWMLLVAAFIEHVVIKMKEGDEKMEAITLHHCCQIQGLMENQPDLRSTDNLHQIIRILNDYHEESISHELRFGMKCAVCLSDLSEPAALPCEHVFCVSCLRRSIQEDTPFCPLCRAPLPGNFLPTASSTIDLALEQHREMRERCNAFFLEVVSRFCLTDGQEPVEDLVELLLSLLISAQGDVYKTRALTPFLECVDQSPVVRSVLPKLLLHHSFKLVKKHIRMYLENLENKLLDAEDRTELYRLFVNCFQDLLLSCGLNESTRPGKRAGGVTEDSSFLSRVARRQTSSRQDDPAEFLLSMARLRVCLDAVARILVRVLAQQDDEHEEAELKQVAQVKAVCEYADHDWFRVYLLRSLNRQGGTDLLRALIHSPEYHWIFPSQILRHHQLIGTEVDRVLCCGPSYRSLRDAVGEVLLGGRVDPLNQPLQAANVSGPVLLTLAVFRQVTSRFYSPEGKRHPQAQEVVLLGEFVRQTLSGHVRDLCASLLANQIGGPGSFLSVSADVPARRRVLLELLVHASAVFFSGKELLRPLHVIASRPQSMSEAFLPTMPDNYTSEAQQWLGGEKLTMYLCANGHPSFVGNCGKPMDLAKCDTCGVPIGGQNHNPVLGFTRAQGNLNRDLTQTGHVLGRAVNRSEAPNRTLTLAQSCVLRLCLHLAMMQGTIHYPQGVSSMISPTVHNVAGFLWEHLEKDMEVLGKTLDLNMDDTTIVLHLIFERFLQTSSGAGMNLSSRRSRERWESAVCTYVISPVLMNLSRMLARAQDLMAADRLTDSPLMKLLRGDPRDILPLPSDCPTHHSAFWSLSPVLTMESFSQQIDQAQTPLLTLYVNKVKCVRQLIHLPSLASLLSELVSVFPPGFHTRLSITSLLCSLPSVHQKKWLSERVGIFVEVWNRLRMEISGLSEELCETDLSMESSGQFLLASRRGAGSCLHAVVDLLSETHNSLVRESRKLCHHNPSDYNVPVMALSESQIALCHPEKDFLPLVLANCHYTLEKGQQTVSFCDHQAIERELSRRYFAGKPRIKTDTDKYLRRQHQNFSEVLEEVRAKITQEPLKASVLASMRSVLRSFTDVCDALHAVEIGLRFLGKTGGDGHVRLLVYLTDSLKMQKHISSSVAEALKENRLRHCTSTWQLLSCWKSQQMMKKGQDPFQRLSEDFRKSLTSEERRLVRVFLTVTDTDVLSLELHEILQLQTSSSVEDGFAAHWDFRTTMEIHLEKKNIPSIPGLDDLSDEITLAKAIEIWKLAVEFKQS